MKRTLRNVFTWMLVVTVLVGFFPGTPVGSAATAPELQPGEVGIFKTARQTAEDEWEITLSVKGKDLVKSNDADVVLVIDRSGSMEKENRLGKAKDAAKTFVDKLLVNGSSSKIALVSFSGEASVSKFYQDNDKKKRNPFNFVGSQDKGKLNLNFESA